jgi:hypothetical protein
MPLRLRNVPIPYVGFGSVKREPWRRPDSMQVYPPIDGNVYRKSTG